VDRRTFLAGGLGLLAGSRLSSALERQARRPRATSSQLIWQRDELALFLHFGVNTFTDREWGDGREDPAIFAPGNLDARQWARTARAAASAR
jgi:alpha-L-fucosidase